MAIYRNVQLGFWTDSKVEDDFTPEDKYFYLYLITNPQTNICGCYQISYAQMTNQTGYNKETIKRLIERFENVHNIIRFCADTKEILLLNWHKYNLNKSEKTLAGAENVAKYIKTPEFKEYVFHVIDCIRNDTAYMGYQCPMQASVSVSVSVSDTDTVSDSDTPKESKSETRKQMFEKILTEYNISDYLLETVRDWLEYKKERGFAYKENGLRSLLKQITENVRRYGDEAVSTAISESMANGYQGIIFDKIRGRTRDGTQNAAGSDWLEKWRNA